MTLIIVYCPYLCIANTAFITPTTIPLRFSTKPDNTSYCIPLCFFLSYSPRPAVGIFDPIRRSGWCSFPVERAIGGLD